MPSLKPPSRSASPLRARATSCFVTGSRRLHRPDSWKRGESYVEALSETLTPDARRTLREDVIGRVRQVATAAGGFLGLGRKNSASEQKVLDRLEKSFG